MSTILSKQSDRRYITEEDPVWKAAYFAGIGQTFKIGELLFVLTESHSQDEFVALDRATNQGKVILIKNGIDISHINEQSEQNLLLHDVRVEDKRQDISVQVILSIPKPQTT